MKLSWYGLRISIADAKLSHLVQKNKIWDHGIMIEQMKMIFSRCKGKNPVIKEVVIIEVPASKRNKGNGFIALIKGRGIVLMTDKEKVGERIDFS